MGQMPHLQSEPEIPVGSSNFKVRRATAGNETNGAPRIVFALPGLNNKNSPWTRKVINIQRSQFAPLELVGGRWQRR